MVECDYCGATVGDEDALLRHLDAEHDGELGAIDRRRVGALENGGSGLAKAMVGGGVLFVLVAVAFLALPAGDDPGAGPAEGPPERRALAESGNATLLADVQSFPGGSREHVAADRDVQYDHLPPTGGPHYRDWARSGYYETPKPYELLVHNLEHGHVVVYYDPAALTPTAEASLRAYARNHTGDWSSVVVVPNPEDDPGSAYVLTAWGARLLVDDYDPEVVHAFLAEYLGRGPENPVR